METSEAGVDDVNALSQNQPNKARSQVGRPLVLAPQERRARLLRAAMKIFSTKGYAAATVDAIAVEAGMSKKTLYQVFASKTVLFDALLEEQLYRIPIPEPLEGLDPDEELAQLLLSLAGFLLAQELHALVRLIVMEGQASPELMTVFERLEMGRDLNHIEKWIIRQENAGYLKIDDVAATARLLFNMTLAGPFLSALLRAPLPEREESLSQQIRQNLHIFLVGIGAKLLKS